MSHEFSKIPHRSLNKQMKMIFHENIAVEFYLINMKRCGKQAKELLLVFFGSEYLFALVPPARDMVCRAGILNSQRSCHKPILYKRSVSVNAKELTPLTTLHVNRFIILFLEIFQ